MVKEKIKSRKILIFSIITMALPAIMEMALNTMLGVSDTIMISRMIGTEALSAVGFANQIVFILIFIFSSFNTGAIAMISRSLGAKDYKTLCKIAQQNVSLNLSIGIIILALAIPFAPALLGIFDTTEFIQQQSILYFRIILVGFLPMFLCFAFTAILRGSGDTVTPMVVTAIANGINIVGNFILIRGLGPIPAMGIAGAAWATSGSRIIALCIYIYMLYIRKSKTQIHFSFQFDRKILQDLWSISLPGAVEQTMQQLSFLIMSVIISQLDTISEAAFRVLIQIESISFMPAVGMSIATATLVGKSLGAKEPDEAVEIGYLSSGMGMLWGGLIGLCFILFPNSIVGLFSSDQALIQASAVAMIFLGINQIGLNFNIVLTGALRGAGDTHKVMQITAARIWLMFVPLTYVFIIILKTGISGVWYAEIGSFILFGIVLYYRFKGRKWIPAISYHS